ncbi:unnamed protein product [Rotaria sp. Silwood2]|nr:unnamed protein product [Rotaria sp. Silwood2]
MILRRQVLHPRVFTLTQCTPQPSYYILLFEDTSSYSIVARLSLKQINDDVAFTKILALKVCNTEYVRLTPISQYETEEQDDGSTFASSFILK